MLQQSIEQFLARNWLACTVVAIVFIWLPEMVSNIWGLFYSEPIFAALGKRLGEMNLPSFSPYWITVPISVAMFAYIAYLKRSEKAPEGSTSEPKSPMFKILKIKVKPQPLLKIEYKYEEVPGEGFFNWFTDNEGRNIQRFRIRIRNLGSTPIQNAEVKLETIEQLESETCGIKPISSRQVGYWLKFEKSGAQTLSIHGNDSEWVPVLSFQKQIFGHISIEGVDKKGSGIDTEGKIMSPSNPHRIKIIARGTGVREDVVFFLVRLENLGGTQRLSMKQVDG
jgi:hypothetical protein